MRYEYVLPEDVAVADIADLLRHRFALEDHGGQRWVICYFDTFDWRLFNKGYVLEEHRNGSSNHLHWRSVDQPASERVLPNARMPVFARDLPSGAFRERLSQCTEPRALLPQVIVHSQAQTLNLENEEGKTLARLVLETGRLADGDHPTAAKLVSRRLRFEPLRGYERACRGLHKEVERLGLEPARHSLMVEALAVDGRRPAAYEVRPRVSLEAHARTDEAGRALLAAYVGVMCANLPGVRARTDPEFLHDFRTSVRRARALLPELNGVLPKRTLERFRRDLRWLGEITGPARDLDVLLLALDDYAAMLDPGPPQEAFATRCRPVVARELERAYERLHERLASVRFSRLEASLKEFISSPAPRRTPLEHAMTPVTDYAKQRLARRFKKLRKGAQGAGDGENAEVLHDARILAKRCRYLLDAFASLLPKRRVRDLRGRLKALQDQLGAHHDCYVHEQTLDTLAERMRLEDALEPEVVSAIEELKRKLRAEQQRLGKQAAKMLKAFAGSEVKGLCREVFATP